ncbi:C2 domain [Dillenia turbinata]|uniref:C2 domain n=1 Tax=Dillenia turbinata TaxID=194707 RepID=A0AAN8VLD1_9MAGN
MEKFLGLLRIRVLKGVNLVVRDTRASDPYVVISAGDKKVKTKVVKNNINPEWNDELTLGVADLNHPILLTVYDKDSISRDDRMGDAEIDIKPYVEHLKMGVKGLDNDTTVCRLSPTRENCLAEVSCIIWKDGKLVQDMCLRLRNVERGEIHLQLEWITPAGSKGLHSA